MLYIKVISKGDKILSHHAQNYEKFHSELCRNSIEPKGKLSEAMLWINYAELIYSESSGFHLKFPVDACGTYAC